MCGTSPGERYIARASWDGFRVRVRRVSPEPLRDEGIFEWVEGGLESMMDDSNSFCTDMRSLKYFCCILTFPAMLKTAPLAELKRGQSDIVDYSQSVHAMDKILRGPDLP